MKKLLYNLVFVFANLFFFSAWAHKGPNEIWIDDPELLQTLQEENRRFHEYQILKEVDREIEKSFPSMIPQEKGMVPICDKNRPPFAWGFASQGSDWFDLHYLGGGVHSTFMTWGEGNWVRLSGDLNNDGMFCLSTDEPLPNVNNWLEISLGQHLLSSMKCKRAVASTLERAFLQVAMKLPEEKPSAVVGHVRLASAPSLKEGVVYLELWQASRKGWELLKTQTRAIQNGYHEPAEFDLEAGVEPGAEVRLIMKVDKEILSSPHWEPLAKVRLYEARLTVK